MEKIINGNSLTLLPKIKEELKNKKIVLISDPPYNLKYHYNTYQDNLKETEYLDMLYSVFNDTPSIIIHYSEMLYKIAIKLNKAPIKVVSWVYNSNTPRQHRDIAFFDIKPDFSKVKQPYKNQNDKRIKNNIACGKGGANLYDWWEVQQVKNVSKEKTSHPCQIPLQVMLNIIMLLPKDYVIIDPFAGSGTTLLAAKILHRDFIGIEIDKSYCEIIEERLAQTLL